MKLIIDLTVLRDHGNKMEICKFDRRKIYVTARTRNRPVHELASLGASVWKSIGTCPFTSAPITLKVSEFALLK
jgi:hypothetical protein